MAGKSWDTLYTTGQKFSDNIQIMHTFIIKNQFLPLERQILNLL